MTDPTSCGCGWGTYSRLGRIAEIQAGFSPSPIRVAGGRSRTILALAVFAPGFLDELGSRESNGSTSSCVRHIDVLLRQGKD